MGVTVAGNSITKTAAAGWNAGTFSDQVITADGWYSTTVAETNTHRMIGLSDSDTDVSFTSIDYAIYLRSNGALGVYENGANKGEFGSYATGDVLSVQRTGSTITYLKNGSVFYTSTVASTGDLHVDTSLNTTGATLQNIVIDRHASCSASDNYLLIPSRQPSPLLMSRATTPLTTLKTMSTWLSQVPPRGWKMGKF